MEVTPRFKEPKDPWTWAKAVAAVKKRSGGECEARWEPFCTGHASQVHHVKPRSRGGTHNPANLVHVCLSCHHAGIHAFPTIARERGFTE